MRARARGVMLIAAAAAITFGSVSPALAVPTTDAPATSTEDSTSTEDAGSIDAALDAAAEAEANAQAAADRYAEAVAAAEAARTSLAGVTAELATARTALDTARTNLGRTASELYQTSTATEDFAALTVIFSASSPEDVPSMLASLSYATGHASDVTTEATVAEARVATLEADARNLSATADAAEATAATELADFTATAEAARAAATARITALFAAGENVAGISSTSTASAASFADYIAVLDSAGLAEISRTVLNDPAAWPAGLTPVIGTDGAPTSGVANAEIEGATVLVLPKETLDAVELAFTRIGLPYVWGGGNASGPSAGLDGTGYGLDCSGLVVSSYIPQGFTVPRTADSQYRSLPSVPLADALPGDLLFFGTAAHVHHVGINLGGGMFLNASTFGVPLGVQQYHSDLIAAARVSLQP